MRNLEILSAHSSENLRTRTQVSRRPDSRLALAAILCGLAVIAVSASWIWFGSPGKMFLLGLFRSTTPGSRAMPKPGAEKIATNRLTISEMAALAVIGGVGAPEKARLPNALRRPQDGAGTSASEEALLLSALETGSEADAVEAVSGLAALGGSLNLQRLAAIMKDSRWPEAIRTAAAQSLLAIGNPDEAALAVRVLASIGGEANTDILNALINDPNLPQTLRLEAALGLGVIATPRAGDALIQAFGTFSDPDSHEQLLGALGHFPFPQIEATWKQYLADPNTDRELRVAAVDALSNSTPEALPFLKTVAGSDQDPEVREMSAWAISALGAGDESMGPELARMATAEPEPDVRRRLYEALSEQQINPSETLLPVIQAETDIAARVAGFNALGDAVRRSSSLVVAEQFNSEVIPELTRIALSTESMNIRMRAVFALRRANTAAARQALQEISQTPTQKIADAARHGLQTKK